MGHEAWPVAITSIRGVVAGTVVWRQLGRLNVTVVLKATFALVPDAMMTPASPRPLARDEQVDETGRALLEAGDLAPYLRQCDVWLTGSIEAPTGPVRLGLFRDKTALIDKSIDPRATAGADPSPARGAGGAARARQRIRVAGFGPLSRGWPVRSRLPGAAGLRQLPGPLVEIPDTFDWAYFQVAPPDQRVDRLRGDEWIVLAGVHPKRASFSTRLPGVKGAARIHDRSRGGPGQPLELTADTVRIDLDRQICSITWRGRFPVATPDALASTHVVAAIEWPGRPIAWSEPSAPKASLSKTRRAPQSARTAPRAAPAAAVPHDSTMAISSAEVVRLAASAAKATPFEGRPAPQVSLTDPGGTAPIDVGAVLKARESSVPFAPVAPADASIPLGMTAAIDIGAVLKARESSVPFAPAAPADASIPLGMTAAIDVGAVLAAAAVPAIPFVNAIVPPPPPVAIPPEERALAWSPPPAPIREVAPAYPPPPPEEPALPPPPVLAARAAELPPEAPKTPGAHFIAAMARRASAAL